jgi:hypothetical protein
MTDERSEFEDFTASLGRLMERGLNQLPTETKKMISEAVDGGGMVFAVCTPEPPTRPVSPPGASVCVSNSGWSRTGQKRAEVS